MNHEKTIAVNETNNLAIKINTNNCNHQKSIKTITIEENNNYNNKLSRGVLSEVTAYA